MKKMYVALLCLALAALMAGCAAGNASGADASASPKASDTPMPAATMTPANSPTAAASAQTSPGASMSPEASPAANDEAVSAMTPAQAGRLAERVGDAVERLSEVDDAEAVIRDGRVLVAVEFEDQYRAGLDDRMKQMITEAVRSVDDSLTDVQITDDDTLYGQVKNLGARVSQVTGLDELADDFGDLWDRIVGR